ncbi:hypothetical protein [Hymenobacter metallilatus]|nr:hypothetical protein [Hymenobacter metallilatus]
MKATGTESVGAARVVTAPATYFGFDLAEYPQPVTFAPRFHPALPDR